MVSKNRKNTHPNWRPDFCNRAALPDIKVVRTNFLINFVCVLSALVFVYFTLEREYNVYALGQTVASMERQVQSASSANEASLKLSNAFKKASNEIIDVERFFIAPFKAHEFLVDFVKLCPEEADVKSIAFSEVYSKGSKVEYKMNITGEVVDALSLDAFKNSIEASGLLEVDNLSPMIDETLQDRNVDTGIFPYRMSIVLAPQKKSLDKKAKGGS